MVVGKPQLARRTQHSEALDTAQLCATDPLPTAQHGSGTRHRNDVAGLEVLGATHHLVHAASVVDLADGEMIRTGDLLERHDASGDDIGVLSERAVLASFHLETRERQTARKLVRRQVSRAQLPQPFDRHLHNCSRNRTSFSNSMRRSSIPCRSIASRSIPTPNA